MKLQDKIAVVTGGNSGIGRAIAEEFANQGARVVIFGRSQATLDETRDALGEGHVAVQGDVARIEDLERLFSVVREKHGRVDVLVANAGIAPMGPFEEVDEVSFESLFATNVKGAYFTIQKALPLLGEGSSVVLTGSAAGRKGFAGTAAYSATKAAVRSLAQTLSAELLPRGIRVNNLSPGPIETPLFGRLGLPQEAMDEMVDAFVAQTPIGRFGSSDEMAKAALFLASTDSSFVVGADLVADGGISTL